MNEPVLLEAHIVGNKIEARFAFDHIHELVNCYRTICDEHGAQNYLEMRMADKEGNEFIVTVQRGGKPTPHMLRQKAEADYLALRAECEHLRQIGADVCVRAAADSAKLEGEIAAARAECEGLRAILVRIRDDKDWRTNDNRLWPDILKAIDAGRG